MIPIAQSWAAKRDKIISVPLVIFCQSFQALTIGGIALFMPVIRRDLQLTFAQGGSLSTVSTILYALMQLPAGYMTDRFGPKKLFVIGMLGTTTLAFTFGFVTDYWHGLLNQTLSGFFRGFLFAPGLALIAGWFPPEKRATAMGLYLIGGYSGSVLLDIGGPLLVSRFDWRFPFLAITPLGILATLALWRLGKEPPSAGPGHQVSAREILQLLRLRLIWVCGVIQYVRLAVMVGTAFWLSTVLVEEKGLSLEMAGLIIAMRAALMGSSNVIGGYASDRLKNPTLVIAFALIVLMVTTLLIAVLHNVALLVVVIAINSIGVQMHFGPLFAIPVEILGDRASGTCSGIGNFFANTGSLTFVFLLGALKDATGGFLAGFIAIALACLVGLGFTAALAGMRRAALQKPG